MRNLHLAPGPPGVFRIGGLSAMREDALSVFEHVWREYGDLVRLDAGNDVIHIASHPDLIRTVMLERPDLFAKHYGEPGVPYGLQPGVNESLLNQADYEGWLSHHRVKHPLYHRERIAAMSDSMVAAGQRQLDAWRRHYRSGDTIDISSAMQKVTLDVIAHTMFTSDLWEEAESIGEAIDSAMQFSHAREYHRRSLPLWLPQPHFRRIQHTLAQLDSVIHKLIDNRRKADVSQHDLLDVLLDARDADTGERMSDDEIQNELKTIFAAGHETTAAILKWTFYLLGKHPAVYQALCSQVDAVLDDRLPRYDDLQRLPMIRHVIEEAMRLYPPVGAFTRLARTHTDLWGYEVPGGSQVVACIHNMHRHPDFWDDPNAFRPQRFADMPDDDAARWAYMPFGTGPLRRCMGRDYALLEAQLLLALFTQYVTFHTIPGFEAQQDTSTTSASERLLLTLNYREQGCSTGHGLRLTRASS